MPVETVKSKSSSSQYVVVGKRDLLVLAARPADLVNNGPAMSSLVTRVHVRVADGGKISEDAARETFNLTHVEDGKLYETHWACTIMTAVNRTAFLEGPAFFDKTMPSMVRRTAQALLSLAGDSACLDSQELAGWLAENIGGTYGATLKLMGKLKSTDLKFVTTTDPEEFEAFAKGVVAPTLENLGIKLVENKKGKPGGPKKPPKPGEAA